MTWDCLRAYTGTITAMHGLVKDLNFQECTLRKHTPPRASEKATSQASPSRCCMTLYGNRASQARLNPEHLQFTMLL